MNREEILARPSRREETVEVPEWGGSVIVRSLSAVERVRFYGSAEVERMQQESPARLGVALLIASLYDQHGNRVFQPGDAPALEQMDGGLINRLCAVANRVNGLTGEAEAEAKKK